MKTNLSDYPSFLDAVQNKEIVYLFGAGISSALTDNESCSWRKWIYNGTYLINNTNVAERLRKSMDEDGSTDNLIKVVGEVIELTKEEGTYLEWMRESFESATITNHSLAATLKKMLIAQDVFTTTNYDLLLEKATGLGTISYEEPSKAFAMIDKRLNDSVVHLHGVFDSQNKIDNIIADKSQYENVIRNQGAQFIQHILGTKTLIFVGCGQTTEDGNISQLIQFANKYLNMDIPYYFLYKNNNIPEEMPDNIKPIPYGDEYSDLPLFLEDMAQSRLKAIVSKHSLIGRTAHSNKLTIKDNLMQYHYSQELIPFCGRQEELNKLFTFVNSNKKFSWWSITGQAGAGKSRLAFELLKRLPASWLGFFLNDGTTKNDIDKFIPFSNTLIIIDYVSGRELNVAKYIQDFSYLYSKTEYKLRILLIERDNLRQAGSWYSKLIRRFNKYDSVAKDEYSEEFLNIEDLDDSSVERLISEVCYLNGLDEDEERDRGLKNAYAQKFERLRFRPLYLQLFVEAWITNDFSYPHYDTYEDLLSYTLKREQEKWLVTLDGDQETCNALIRLIIRANISGYLDTRNIPDIYKDDWCKVEQFIKNHAFPGVQCQEEKTSIITTICQKVEDNSEKIVPMFPDIIKEYMFFLYSDKETLPLVMREIWQNCAKDFTVFITRCLSDFPENGFYKLALNSLTYSSQDIDILAGRLEVLKKRDIKVGDDPIVLYDLVCNEYEFWKSVSVPNSNNDEQDSVATLKVIGLNMIAKQFCAWSNYDMSDMLEAIDASLDVPGGKATSYLKQFYLQEHINMVSKSGFYEEAEYLRNKLNILSKEVEDLPLESAFKMISLNANMMEEIFKGNYIKAYNILKKMDKECDYAEIEAVRILAHSCFNIDNSASQFREKRFVGKGLEIAQKLSIINSDDYEIKATILGCEISVLQYKHLCDGLSNEILLESLNIIEKELESIPFDQYENLNDTLNTMWALFLTLKINCVKQDVLEMNKLIARAEKILSSHPYFEDIANAKVIIVHVLHKETLKNRVSHKEVEGLFEYVELNYTSDSLRKSFFSMLEDSEDFDNRRDYMTSKVMSGAIQGAKYDFIFGSGIPEVDTVCLMNENADYSPQEPYVRTHKKIGVNECCPCGSGKKFKKCCRGKSIYD